VLRVRVGSSLYLLESYAYGATRCAYGPTCLKAVAACPSSLFRRDKGDHLSHGGGGGVRSGWQPYITCA
jgi:hypothetical protein